MVSRGGTPGARKRTKEERKRKIIKSKQPGERPFKEFGSLSAKDPVREELRQREIKKGGEFAKDVEQKEIEAVAKRSFDIGEEKTRLGEEKERLEREKITTLKEIESRPVSQEEIQQDLASKGIVPGIQLLQQEFIARAEGKKPLEEMALYQQLLLQIAATGGTPLPGQFGGTIVETGKTTAIATARQIGKIRKIHPGIVTQYATNGKSTVKTTSWLMKLGITAGIAGGFLTIVGTYPFAGFIKEEALQTLSFATKTAKDSGDLVLEEETIIQTEELLNPGIWDIVINKIPFLNIQNNLKAFFEAAAQKVKNDRSSFEERRGKI